MRDEIFVKNLAQDLKPKVSIVSSQKALLAWLIVTLPLLGIAIALHSIREDMALMLEKASFYFELFSALSVSIIAAGSALTLRIPGSRAPLKVLGTAVLIWLVSLLVHALTMGALPLTFHLHAELACMADIFVFGGLPALVLYHLVRRGATTEPKLALTLVAIAFSSAAAAFLPLACGNDGLVHLLLGHASPLFLAAALAWMTGRRFLSW